MASTPADRTKRRHRVGHRVQQLPRAHQAKHGQTAGRQAVGRAARRQLGGRHRQGLDGRRKQQRAVGRNGSDAAPSGGVGRRRPRRWRSGAPPGRPRGGRPAGTWQTAGLSRAREEGAPSRRSTWRPGAPAAAGTPRGGRRAAAAPPPRRHGGSTRRWRRAPTPAPSPPVPPAPTAGRGTGGWRPARGGGRAACGRRPLFHTASGPRDGQQRVDGGGGGGGGGQQLVARRQVQVHAGMAAGAVAPRRPLCTARYSRWATAQRTGSCPTAAWWLLADAGMGVYGWARAPTATGDEQAGRVAGAGLWQERLLFPARRSCTPALPPLPFSPPPTLQPPFPPPPLKHQAVTHATTTRQGCRKKKAPTRAGGVLPPPPPPPPTWAAVPHPRTPPRL